MGRRILAWVDEGRAIMAATTDEHVLRCLEAWADIVRAEARQARFERPMAIPSSNTPAVDDERGALSAQDCARESGWKRGQVPRRGYSPRWFYDHAGELPFTVRRRGRALRFAADGFRRWLTSPR